ncbi:hypothetical protein AMTR_s00063p00180280 [Amborella trichopoda]|uniref:Uncharacterized protein n=1 Tax=Amborella trichopoda TaxID=13333 RepID=U5D4C6_AMBTC|nr:hypothetical protein AMTR_s00063p00180280 [Amborella trichopoda]
MSRHRRQASRSISDINISSALITATEDVSPPNSTTTTSSPQNLLPKGGEMLKSGQSGPPENQSRPSDAASNAGKSPRPPPPTNP